MTNVIFVGGSGTGKSTLTEVLVQRYGYVRIRTLSTNVARYGNDNPDYQGLSEDDYEVVRARGGLYNDIVVDGWRYGIQSDFLDGANGRPVVLHLVHEWALKVKADFLGMAVILLQAPSVAEQRRRLLLRGDDPQRVDQRLGNVVVQSPPVDGCDLVLVNETGALEATLSKLVVFLGL